MGFGKGLLCSLPFGQATRAGFQREPGRFKSLIERPTRAVHDSSILQRRFVLRLYPRKHLRSVGQERFEGLVASVLIARMTRYDQIRDPVAASFRTRLHVVDFGWPVSCATVSAAMSPFGEQVLAQFGAEEGAALVSHTFQRGIGERLTHLRSS
jgi:hypothetical protein